MALVLVTSWSLDWPLTVSNYDKCQPYFTHTAIYYSTISSMSCIFTSHLIMASKGTRSTSSVYPNCRCTSATNLNLLPHYYFLSRLITTSLYAIQGSLHKLKSTQYLLPLITSWHGQHRKHLMLHHSDRSYVLASMNAAAIRVIT
jgi:hypothetical protein